MVGPRRRTSSAEMLKGRFLTYRILRGAGGRAAREGGEARPAPGRAPWPCSGGRYAEQRAPLSWPPPAARPVPRLACSLRAAAAALPAAPAGPPTCCWWHARAADQAIKARRRRGSERCAEAALCGRAGGGAGDEAAGKGRAILRDAALATRAGPLSALRPPPRCSRRLPAVSGL